MMPPVCMVSHLPCFVDLLLLAAIIVCGLECQAMMHAFLYYVRQRTYTICCTKENTRFN